MAVLTSRDSMLLVIVLTFITSILQIGLGSFFTLVCHKEKKKKLCSIEYMAWVSIYVGVANLVACTAAIYGIVTKRACLLSWFLATMALDVLLHMGFSIFLFVEVAHGIHKLDAVAVAVFICIFLYCGYFKVTHKYSNQLAEQEVSLLLASLEPKSATKEDNKSYFAPSIYLPSGIMEPYRPTNFHNTGVLQPSGKIAQVQQDHHYQSQHIDFSMPFDPKVLNHSDTESSEFDFQNDQQPEQATTYQELDPSMYLDNRLNFDKEDEKRKKKRRRSVIQNFKNLIDEKVSEGDKNKKRRHSLKHFRSEKKKDVPDKNSLQIPQIEKRARRDSNASRHKSDLSMINESECSGSPYGRRSSLPIVYSGVMLTNLGFEEEEA